MPCRAMAEGSKPQPRRPRPLVEGSRLPRKKQDEKKCGDKAGSSQAASSGQAGNGQGDASQQENANQKGKGKANQNDNANQQGSREPVVRRERRAPGEQYTAEEIGETSEQRDLVSARQRRFQGNLAVCRTCFLNGIQRNCSRATNAGDGTIACERCERCKMPNYRVTGLR